MATKAVSTDISQSKLDSELRRIFVYVRDYFQRYVNDKEILAYKNYLLYTMDRQVQIEKFQTNMKVPVIKQYVDTMFAAIYDNDIAFRVTARNKKDLKKAKSFNDFLDWAFTISGSYDQLMEIIKETLIVGRGFGRISFHNGNEEVEYKKGGETRKYLVEGEKYPKIRYTSCFDIFYDPTAQDVESSRYVIERRIMHINDILQEYAPFIGDKANAIREAQKNPYYFNTHDYNRVKLTSFWNNETIADFINSNPVTWTSSTNLPSDFNIYYKNFLTIDYKGWYSEVLEYWEDDTFKLIIDGESVYNGSNPFPIKKKPYFGIHYGKIPGIGFSHGIGTSLEWIQNVSDTIMNLSIDNVKMLIAPMFQRMRWGDTFGDGSTNLTYAPFKVHEVNTPDGLKRLELWVQDFSGPNFLDFLSKVAEMGEWINSYATGYQNKVERSAAWVTAMVESFKARLLPMMDSINWALTRISEFWWIIALTLMEDEIDVRVLDEDGQASFTTMSPNDFVSRYDVEIDPRSLKASTKDVRKKQILDMIQLAAQTGQDPSTGEFFLDMRELWDGLLRAYDLDVDDIILDSKELAKKVAKSQKAQSAAGWMMPWAPTETPWMNPAALASNPQDMGEPPADSIPEQSQILQSAYQS
mgnify:CR=1 FL=1